MKPVFVPHSVYQAFILQQLRTHYGSGVVIINKDWPLAVKLWKTDLSAITTLLQDAYSNQGPMPSDPAFLLRSYFISLMTNPEIGVTEWINEMKRTPILPFSAALTLTIFPVSARSTTFSIAFGLL